MNEIQRLADRAKNAVPKGILTPDKWIEEYNKIFAELIVRECASIVEGSPWNLPRGYKAVDQAELVKKHFGVE